MIGGELVLDGLQTRSFELLAVQPRQQRSKQPYIFKCARGRFEDLFCWLTKHSKDDSLDDDDREKRRSCSQLSPNHGRNNGRNGQEQSEPAQTLASELSGGFGPFCQRVRMHADLEIPALTLFSKDRHIFTEIQPCAKFDNRRLAFADLLAGRRSQQPVCQGILTHPCPSLREKFKKAPVPEEVQVSRIEARREV